VVLSIEKIRLNCARQCRTFTETLKEARIATGTAQRIKAGKNITPKVAGKLAAALECDPAELLKDGQ
jgi:hypothetical protein